MTDAPTVRDEPGPGLVLGDRYRLESCVGEGGIGRVYRARHLILGSFMAVKILSAEYVGHAKLRRRFEREATALAELSHPNIVKVTDFGVQGTMPYLVMELLEGEDLASLVGRGAVTPSRGLGIVRQVLRALAYSHARGVIHRDVKPQNIFVRTLDDGSDHVQVLDFGLARFVGELSRQNGRTLTQEGSLMGTPAYMAPEQAGGDPVDGRADLYSTGVVLFELVCGRRPFTSADPGELLRAHLLQDPPDPSSLVPGIAPELAGLLRRSLAKAREARFADAAAMLEAVDALSPNAVPKLDDATVLDRASDLAAAPTAVADDATVDAAAGGVAAARVRPAPNPRLRPRPLVLGEREPPEPEPEPSRAPLAVGCVLATTLALGAGFLAFRQLTVDESGPPRDEPTSERVVPPLPAPPRPVPPRPEPEAPPAEPEAPSAEPEAPSAEPASPPADPAALPDPLAGALPEPLGAFRDRVAEGRRLARGHIRQLNQYGRAHPADPRSRLILAHHYVNERSLSWALPLYEEALAIDPAVKGDPELLPDLLEMVRSRALHGRAVERTVRTFGAEALPLARAQLAGPLREEERARLTRLISRLTGER